MLAEETSVAASTAAAAVIRLKSCFCERAAEEWKGGESEQKSATMAATHLAFKPLGFQRSRLETSQGWPGIWTFLGSKVEAEACGDARDDLERVVGPLMQLRIMV